MAFAVSIALMWSNYHYRNYNKKAFCLSIPFIVILFNLIISEFLENILNI
jgi:hypothetical protein